MKSLAIIIAFAVAASADLLPFAFAPLPLGSIQPQGWLLDQMQLMADGLAGHEYDFYLYVNESSWLGGDQEYSNLNEGFPYWFNALVPLAYGLNDDRLKSQVQAAATYVLQHQADDGWIGPETGDARIMWARFPALLGFMQLAEAEQTMTDMVVAGMQKFAVCMNNMLTANYTGYLGTSDDLWGRARFQDMIISLQWLYEHYPQDNGQILLDNMQMLTEAGYDWAYWFLDAFIKENLYDVSLDITNALFQFEHGVNAGQGLKSGAVIRRFTNNDTLLASTRQGVDWTFKYHGAASGTILADERLDGLSPMTGSELCTAVETMYSLSYLYEALGDNDFADRSERAAFNALPTMLTADWWAHQYMAEPNQGYSQDLTESPFWNVNTLGQTFGLEPNYPCCAVNHPQGYPKFLSNSFVTVGNNGLGHALLSPATATSTLPGGNKVTVSCNTKYPFDFSLSYTASASSAFDLYLRVPGWALSSSVSVNSGASSPLKPDRHTGMAKVSLPAGQSIVEYTLSADTTLDLRANNTVAVYHGPLLYALQIGEDIIAQPPRNWGNQSDYPSGYAPTQSHDYTINNLTAWNIAIDPSTISYQVNLSAGSDPLPNPIWTSGGPPGFMTFRGCEIAWPIEKGVPTNPPQDRTCTAAPTEYTMIPYGAAKLHMAEMPIVNLTSQRVRGLI